MRLFHVSEEADIRRFEPRRPTRVDLDPETGLVWAIDEKHLPNFLAPRDCPRVTYSVREDTTTEDRERFFTSKNATHALILEHGWLNALRSTTLYLYEFDPAGFILQDGAAGYYIATTTQVPPHRSRRHSGGTGAPRGGAALYGFALGYRGAHPVLHAGLVAVPHEKCKAQAKMNQKTVHGRTFLLPWAVFQDLVLGVKSTLARYPKVTAAAMPPAVAVTPPVSAPSSPFCCTAFCVPIASE